MEQQMTLKNDEMQEKWKTCILTTCYAYRMADSVKEIVEIFQEAVRQFINSIAEVFKPIVETLALTFKDFFDKVEDLYDYEKSYPLNYPPIVNNFKINTKGFPRPIIGYARSRC